MAEDSASDFESKTPFLKEPATRRWLASSAILAVGLIIGGFALGDGLKRAQLANRAVTVKGLAERDVTADLATWTIAYSSTAGDMATAQANVDADTVQLRGFFKELGFPADALQTAGVNVQQSSDNGVASFTVRQRMTLRTTDIARAQQAVRRQFDLVKRGVMLEDGSGMAYTFTKLNAIKPKMVADATTDARAAAEQFAHDSGAQVGAIRSATQGYFSIEARDGDSGSGTWGVSDTPYKKVRVVTTVEFYLK